MSESLEKTNRESAVMVQENLDSAKIETEKTNAQQLFDQVVTLVEVNERFGDKEIIDVDTNQLMSFFRQVIESYDVETISELFIITISEYSRHGSLCHHLVSMFAQENVVPPKTWVSCILKQFLSDTVHQDQASQDLFTEFMFRAHRNTAFIDEFRNVIVTLFGENNFLAISRILDLISMALFYSRMNPLYTNLTRDFYEMFTALESSLPSNYFIQEKYRQIKEQPFSAEIASSRVRVKYVNEYNKSLQEARMSIVSRVDKDPETLDREVQEVRDYAELMSADFRARIERDLGFKMDWLLPRERYYLLNFLKRSERARVLEISDFYHKFSQSGIRTFMTLDYDQEIGDEILRFSRNNEQLAKEVFVNFDVLIDNIYAISELITKAISQSNQDFTEFELKALKDQLFEALLRKSKDLLIGIISSEKYNTDPEIATRSIHALSIGLFRIVQFFSEDPYFRIDLRETQTGQKPQFELTDITGKKVKMKFGIRPSENLEGQARINIEMDFDTDNPDDEAKSLFHNKTEWLDGRRKNIVEDSVFRLGIDLDTSDGEPKLSFDIGRAEVNSQKRRSTGEGMGNILAKVAKESTHTPYSFDRRFADPKTFKSIALSFDKYLEEKIESLRTN